MERVWERVGGKWGIADSRLCFMGVCRRERSEDVVREVVEG